MKTISKIVSVLLVMTLVTSCAQKNQNEPKDTKPIMQKEASLDMNKDSLDYRIVDDLEKQVVERKLKLTDEALSTIGETYTVLDAIDKGNKEEAIKKGHILIGKLEVLLTREPELKLIPINVNYQKHELVTTIDEVRAAIKSAKEAMDDGYYQMAGDILKNVKSEMVINTYYLPAGTFPPAIKAAIALLEEDKPDAAKAILTEALSSIVIEEKVQPLPVLYAEQMIIEAANVDKVNHDNKDKVLNLLNNADYQLTLAEEMGYGKKDKDFELLSESIKVLKESVKNGEDSNSKFEALKKDMIKFKNKLFSGDKK